jgi:hypothetical protein
MPNKYEREIEEILRNMDRTDTRTSVSNRVRSFNRPRRRVRPSWNLSLNRTEALLLIGAVLVLLAAGLTYYKNGQQIYLFGTNWLALNGVLAIVGFLLIVVGLALAWRDRFRGITPGLDPSRTWRGASVVSDSTDNIVDLAPRRGPLSGVTTRVRLLRLKLRYRRTRGRE